MDQVQIKAYENGKEIPHKLKANDFLQYGYTEDKIQDLKIEIQKMELHIQGWEDKIIDCKDEISDCKYKINISKQFIDHYYREIEALNGKNEQKIC